MKHTGSLLGGTLIIAGTCIGGGILGLPVVTAPGGFFPSTVIFLCCWAFMTLTGLLFLELSLNMKKDANIITMAKTTLGKGAAFFTTGLYFFLFYCLSLAYIIGGGNFIYDIIHGSASPWICSSLFVLLFAPFVCAGTKYVNIINIPMMIGLGLTYLTFVSLGLPLVQSKHLMHQNWGYSLMAMPVAFTSFAYHGVIPSIISYLNRDIKRCRQAIIIGSSIPFFIYFLWQWLVLGIVPLEGPGALREALSAGHNAISPLILHLNNPWFILLAQCFGFFALTTSFFGVTLGLKDFISDGLRNYNIKAPIRWLFVFLPPFLLAVLYPDSFLQALNIAGGYGCAILLGLLPIIMVWAKRRRNVGKSPYKLFGGTTLLAILLAFVIFEITLETYQELGLGPVPAEIEIQK